LVSWLAPLFVALALAAMALGLYEFWLLARKRGLKPDVVVGFAGAAAFFTVFYFDRPQEVPVLLLLVLPALVIAALAAAMLRGAPFDNMIASVGATVLGVMYVAFLGGHLVGVRMGFEQVRAARSRGSTRRTKRSPRRQETQNSRRLRRKRMPSISVCRRSGRSFRKPAAAEAIVATPEVGKRCHFLCDCDP
jgi:hypothetical protein